MKISRFLFFQMLVCLLCITVLTHKASADVTVDFLYGIQDSADCTNGVLLKIQLERNGETEEIFAGETLEVGAWADPQSVEIPSDYIGQEFTLVWVIDPLGDINCDWLVIGEPWLVVNGAKEYSFFDSYDEAEYTTVDVDGESLSHGDGEAGRDAMWDDAGALFVQLPWSKEHGIDSIPDSVGGVLCEGAIFAHPPQKGPTSGGTTAVRFEIFLADVSSVSSTGKLTTTWGDLKSR